MIRQITAARKSVVGRAVVALCLLLTACQAARMPLPDGLSERWPVEGRQGWMIQESLRFGPYTAVEVDRSWTRGRDREVPVYEGNDREQQYAFTLADNGRAAWLVKCRAALVKRTVRTPVVDVDLKNRSRLDCALTEADGPTTWLLTLEETNEKPLEGRLHIEGDEISVRGTTALEGSLRTQETSGYNITHGGRPVAAVEVVNSGSVTLAPSLESQSRSLLAAAAAALLLLEELRGSLEV